MTNTEKIEQIIKKLKTRKSKNIIYTVAGVAVVFVFGYRFFKVSQENNFDVFNIVRHNISNGTPVEVLNMKKTNGILLEPLTVKNNIAYVSGARISQFHAGQKLGDCKIVSVSKNIDLDTAMHIIKTSKCSDGLKYVEKEKNGFYVPVSSVHGNVVYVANNGVAESREIVIADRDAQNILIKSGLQDGDMIILSNVKNNEKIKIEK